MKKHRSVFELMVRSNFYRILLLLVAMVILQTGLFLFAFYRRFGTEAFSLESVLKKSYIELVFFGVFIGMNIFLKTSVGYEGNEKPQYTMMRLSIAGKEVYYWHAASNVLYYLLFFAVEILTIVMLGFLYLKMAPAEYVTGQTLFLACYRSDLLHSLLPLGDFPYLIRNILGLAAASLYSACYPKEYAVEDEKKGEKEKQRNWKNRFDLFVFVPVLFIGEFGDYFYCILLIIFGAAYIMWKIGRIRQEEMESRQEEIIQNSENERRKSP